MQYCKENYSLATGGKSVKDGQKKHSKGIQELDCQKIIWQLLSCVHAVDKALEWAAWNHSAQVYRKLAKIHNDGEKQE